MTACCETVFVNRSILAIGERAYMQSSKTFRLRLLLPTLLALMAMLVVACGGNNTTGNNTNDVKKAAADKQVFRYPIGPDDFSTLDPAQVQLATDGYAVGTLFTGLVEYNTAGELVPVLAASLPTISPDGLTYSFTLRPGLKFSNGDPLTARDVAFSIDRVLNPALKSPVASYMSLLKNYSKVHKGDIKTAIGDSVIVVDDTHINLVLEAPAAYFLQTVTYVSWYTINQKVVTKYGDKWTDHLDEGAGAGPFKASSYNHTQGLVVVPNENYFGKKPALSKISFEISGTADTTYKAYQSGQYDTAAVPSANLADAKTRKDYKSSPALTIRYLTMNYLRAPFDDINVRKAFALAVDKDLLNTSVLKGSSDPTNHLIPDGMLGYNKDLKGPDGTTSVKGNAEAAKAALAASKYGSADKLPPITFSYATGSSTNDNLVAALQGMWKTVLGVEVKLEGLTSAVLTKNSTATKNNPNGQQIWYAGWIADYPDPQDWVSIFFRENGDLNRMNYGQNSNSTVVAAQKAVQDKLANADVTSDQAARLKLYNEAEQQLVNDIAWAPLFQAKNHSLVNPKLHGYVLTALGATGPDDWADIYITQ
jgi:ABC-type oligopeptide transport system substrate-binding subunit